MKKVISFITLLLALSIFHFQFSIPALAQAVSQTVALTYPIPQLGSCRDARECYWYCEIPLHQTLCQEFTRNHNLSQVLGVSTQESQTDSSTTSPTRVLQTTTDLGIKFPIPILGNCSSFDNCHAFCQDSANRSICTTFAQQKGLKSTPKKITYPIAELSNCSNQTSCRQYCEMPTNRLACKTFATTYNIPKSVSKKLDLLEKAKAELNCTTFSECKQYCDKPINKTRCDDFGHRYQSAPTSSQFSPSFFPAKEASPSGGGLPR